MILTRHLTRYGYGLFDTYNSQNVGYVLDYHELFKLTI